jgi:hypothetical protein
MTLSQGPGLVERHEILLKRGIAVFFLDPVPPSDDEGNLDQYVEEQ